MTIEKFECAKCGYSWLPRTIYLPKMCPNCKNRKWVGDPARIGWFCPNLTQSTLMDVIDYNPETGVFLWKSHDRGGRAVPNGQAGVVNGLGYLVITIKQIHYTAQRLAWLWCYGYLPENCVDHIDEDRLNNRINNLREVSKSCNARNCGNPVNNKSGVRGISRNGDKRSKNIWRASICINQKAYCLGVYSDFTEAVAVRYASEQCAGWPDCNSTSPAYLYLKERGIIK